MRILYMAPDPVPAPKGSGVRIERTVRALRALGHEVELLTPAGTGRVMGLPHETIALPQENYLDRMLAWRDSAARWLKERRADAVWFRSPWEGAAALEWARRAGGRAVYECHGFPSVELPYHYPDLEGSPLSLEKLIAEERATLAGADGVLTHSQTGRRALLMRGVSPERIQLVPNCVDPAVFSPAAHPPPGPPWRLAYVGTLAPWQGLPCLLEGLARARRKHALELQVLGPRKGAWQSDLRRLARALRVDDLVRVSGAVTQEELVPALRAAHVCVAPLPADARNAFQGCCPIKVLEYMGCGRPILATDAAPLKELLVHGRTAYLARAGSPAALAQGIDWLLADAARREALGAAAREEALARWTPAAFSSALSAAVAAQAAPQEAAA